MRTRSFITAGVLLVALLPAVPCGQALADEPLELRNLPPKPPLPHNKADAPAEPAPGAPLLPGATAIPRLKKSSPLPSVSVPQERIIILEGEPFATTPESSPAPQHPEDLPPAKTASQDEATLQRPDPDSNPADREHPPAPSDPPATPVTLEHFLVKTPDEPKKSLKKPGNATPEVAVKPENQPSGEGRVPAPSSARAENRQEKQTPTPQERKKEKNAEKGQPLRIPEGAKEKGDVSFLKGCWVGVRPEYHTKRMVREKFCFDENGAGKRFLSDPAYAGECVGATRALLNRNGVLHMRSDRMYCTNIKDLWGAAEMTCQGEGEHTPCTWIFRDAGGGRQSYTIRFVRE